MTHRHHVKLYLNELHSHAGERLSRERTYGRRAKKSVELPPIALTLLVSCVDVWAWYVEKTDRQHRACHFTISPI